MFFICCVLAREFWQDSERGMLQLWGWSESVDNQNDYDDEDDEDDNDDYAMRGLPGLA